MSWSTVRIWSCYWWRPEFWKTFRSTYTFDLHIDFYECEYWTNTSMWAIIFIFANVTDRTHTDGRKDYCLTGFLWRKRYNNNKSMHMEGSLQISCSTSPSLFQNYSKKETLIDQSMDIKPIIRYITPICGIFIWLLPHYSIIKLRNTERNVWSWIMLITSCWSSNILHLYLYACKWCNAVFNQSDHSNQVFLQRNFNSQPKEPLSKSIHFSTNKTSQDKIQFMHF